MDGQTALHLANKMLSEDAFSQWLGLELVQISPEICELKAKVKKQMLNGFYITHGGILVSIADSALAFLANASGLIAVTTDLQASFLKPSRQEETLVAVAKIISKGKKVVHIQVEIHNQKQELKAFIKGTAYLTNKKHFTEEQ